MTQALPEEAARYLLGTLDGNLPAPDRTLALRGFLMRLYRRQRDLATDEAQRARALGMLGYALSALGRRETALAATQEAVEIRRRLAKHTLDAFLPDLAMSLNNLGAMLSNLGRHEAALAAYEEAVRALARFFLRHPAAFANWMETMLHNYVEACQTLGQEPDAALLEPVVAVLQELAEGEGA